MSVIHSKQIYKKFVGNVPYDCDDDEFFNVFKNLDGFIKAELITIAKKIDDELIIQSKGFGFIIVDSFDNMEKILNSDIKIKDRKLRFIDYIYNDKKHSNIFYKYNTIILKPTNNLSCDNIKNIFKTAGILLNKCFLTCDRKTGKLKNNAIVELSSNDDYVFFMKSEYIIHDGKYIGIYGFPRKSYCFAKDLNSVKEIVTQGIPKKLKNKKFE